MENYVDRISLRREMYARGYTFADVAKMLGLSRQSMVKKMKTRVGFKEEEIAVLCKIFGPVIFFDYACLQNGDRKEVNEDDHRRDGRLPGAGEL